MSKRCPIPNELLKLFPKEGMNFKDLSFLVLKNIYHDGICSKYTFSEYKNAYKKIDKQYIHDMYSKQLKKIKMVFRAFDVEKYLIHNSAAGEKYCLSKLEAIFCYRLFYRMNIHYEIWSRIRNVKNETYQGFIEIYYKCKDKKRYIDELDFFIHEMVKLYLRILKKENKTKFEAINIASALEEHMLFTTQRLTLNMLEQINCIQFKPNTSDDTISIKRWIDYRRYLKQLHYHGGKVIYDINKEFSEQHRSTECLKKYKLTADSYKCYLSYEKNYYKKICNSSSYDDSYDAIVQKDIDPELYKAVVIDQSEKFNDESCEILNKLLKQLIELNPQKYSTVTIKNLLNPYVSDESTSDDVLPISFPSDIMVASLKLEECERNMVYNYYNDYPDFVHI